MNGFCSGTVGFLIGFLTAASPVEVGIDGVPVSAIGAASAPVVTRSVAATDAQNSEMTLFEPMADMLSSAPRSGGGLPLRY